MTSTEISVGDYSEDYDDICDDYPDQLYNPLSAHLYKSSPSSSKGTFVGTVTYCGLEPNSSSAVTKGCLSWLTNSARVYEPKYGGRVGSCGVSANEYSCKQEPK
jgi:hypothetical protein